MHWKWGDRTASRPTRISFRGRRVDSGRELPGKKVAEAGDAADGVQGDQLAGDIPNGRPLERVGVNWKAARFGRRLANKAVLGASAYQEKPIELPPDKALEHSHSFRVGSAQRVAYKPRVTGNVSWRRNPPFLQLIVYR